MSVITRIHRSTASAMIASLDGVVLRCWDCFLREEPDVEKLAAYLAVGWPKCCGTTMELRAKPRADLRIVRDGSG